MVSPRYIGAEGGTAAVAETRMPGWIGSTAGGARPARRGRFRVECGTAAGAEQRLAVDCGAAAGAAYQGNRDDPRAAAVAELGELVRDNGSAFRAYRVCRAPLFGHGGTTPVAELGLVIECRVAAGTTGFRHMLPLVDAAGRSINTVMQVPDWEYP